MSSLTLSHQDWIRINEVILNMNYERDVAKAAKQFLSDINSLVPYEKATIIFFNYYNHNFEVDTFIEQGADENEVKIYKEYYCKIDDILDYMLPTKMHTIRSSDVFNQEERKKTEYYCDYVMPVGTHFSIDSNFSWHKNNNVISFGSLDLFRPKDSKDFTDKELMICKILQPHLETKASQYVSSLDDSVQDFLNNYSLTKREDEIAKLILKGYSNDDIARKLYISISTVKKHVSNIFEKTDTKSRIDLIFKNK